MSATENRPVVHGDEQTPPTRYAGIAETAQSESAAESPGSSWQPGDPLYPDTPRRGHCLNAACGTTWTPPGAVECPECGGPAGEPAVVGEPLCVLDESNDMEAFAALPDCEHCGGTGKDIPPGFWGGA